MSRSSQPETSCVRAPDLVERYKEGVIPLSSRIIGISFSWFSLRERL
jgi:hypothetical protein